MGENTKSDATLEPPRPAGVQHDMENDKTAETIPGADPVAGTIKNPSGKLADSIPHAKREAAKLHEERDKLSARPGPADTSARNTVLND